MADVLVAFATKMGSTAEIAEVIGEELRKAGLTVHVRAAAEVGDITQYTAVLLGSAVYMRRWRPDAVRFLKRFAAELPSRQVWLFHTGPCGDRNRVEPQRLPGRVRRLRNRIGAEGPVTFGGVLNPARAQGLLARWMARGELAGDFRDWKHIQSWARSVAAEITPLVRS